MRGSASQFRLLHIALILLLTVSGSLISPARADTAFYSSASAFNAATAGITLTLDNLDDLSTSNPSQWTAVVRSAYYFVDAHGAHSISTYADLSDPLLASPFCLSRGCLAGTFTGSPAAYDFEFTSSINALGFFLQNGSTEPLGPIVPPDVPSLFITILDGAAAGDSMIVSGIYTLNWTPPSDCPTDSSGAVDCSSVIPDEIMLSAFFGVSNLTDSFTRVRITAVNGQMTGVDNIEFGAVSAVPLPAALPLLASGLGGLGLMGWWRRQRRQHA